jgi:hypothetical protein
LEVFVRLIAEKIEPDDSVMEGVTVRPIDTEDLCATGSFLEVGDVVFGKLLAQVEADRVELGYIAHVPFVYLVRYLLFNARP